MTEDQMYKLAKENPAKLMMEMVRMGPPELIVAAEILGAWNNTPESRACLIDLTKHINALVREGAVYGLTHSIEEPDNWEALEALRNDPSPDVREAVDDALEDRSI